MSDARQPGPGPRGYSSDPRPRGPAVEATQDLVARLIAGGFRLLDAQFMTEHLRQFGAEEIPRARYLRMLAVALRRKR